MTIFLGMQIVLTLSIYSFIAIVLGKLIINRFNITSNANYLYGTMFLASIANFAQLISYKLNLPVPVFNLMIISMIIILIIFTYKFQQKKYYIHILPQKNIKEIFKKNDVLIISTIVLIILNLLRDGINTGYVGQDWFSTDNQFYLNEYTAFNQGIYYVEPRFGILPQIQTIPLYLYGLVSLVFQFGFLDNVTTYYYVYPIILIIFMILVIKELFENLKIYNKFSQLFPVLFISIFIVDYYLLVGSMEMKKIIAAIQFPTTTLYMISIYGVLLTIKEIKNNPKNSYITMLLVLGTTLTHMLVLIITLLFMVTAIIFYAIFYINSIKTKLIIVIPLICIVMFLLFFGKMQNSVLEMSKNTNYEQYINTIELFYFYRNSSYVISLTILSFILNNMTIKRKEINIILLTIATFLAAINIPKINGIVRLAISFGIHRFALTSLIFSIILSFGLITKYFKNHHKNKEQKIGILICLLLLSSIYIKPGVLSKQNFLGGNIKTKEQFTSNGLNQEINQEHEILVKDGYPNDESIILFSQEQYRIKNTNDPNQTFYPSYLRALNLNYQILLPTTDSEKCYFIDPEYEKKDLEKKESIIATEISKKLNYCSQISSNDTKEFFNQKNIKYLLTIKGFKNNKLYENFDLVGETDNVMILKIKDL